MPDYEAILADASRLPVGERMELIGALWDSVLTESPPPLSDEWLAEIQRRSAAHDAGATETVPWEQVRAEALRRAGATDPNANR